MTARNIEKVTRFRPDGKAQLEKMVGKLNNLKIGARDDYKSEQKDIADDQDGIVYYARDNSKCDERRWGGKV